MAGRKTSKGKPSKRAPDDTGGGQRPLPLPECFDCRFNALGHPCVGSDGEIDFAGLAAAYIANGRRNRDDISASADDVGWAFECAHELVANHPQRLLGFLLHGMDACADIRDVCYFAAGPLEDTLDKHGAALIDRLEVMARRSPKVRFFLTGVWGASRIEPSVWARIETVVGASRRIDDDSRTPAHDGGGSIADEAALKNLLAERCVTTVGAIARPLAGGNA